MLRCRSEKAVIPMLPKDLRWLFLKKSELLDTSQNSTPQTNITHFGPCTLLYYLLLYAVGKFKMKADCFIWCFHNFLLLSDKNLRLHADMMTKVLVAFGLILA